MKINLNLLIAIGWGFLAVKAFQGYVTSNIAICVAFGLLALVNIIDYAKEKTKGGVENGKK